MKRSFADILQGLDGDRARKVAGKLPEWAAAGAEIPSALSLEQCSSTATAFYKSSVAGQAAAAAKLRAARDPSQPGGWAPPVHEATGGYGFAAALPDPADPKSGEVLSEAKGNEPLVRSVLDLTGGLGVDSWAFSRVAERVVYYERDAVLAEAAARNFARLGADNIEVRCETVTSETDLPEADLIYADPARRDAAGRKVFLLEDCTPDVLTLLPQMLRKAPLVLLKLSPMADLTMLEERLGAPLQQIHIVELDGEVKELLCLLSSTVGTPPAGPEIILASLRNGLCETLCFHPHEEREAEAVYATELHPGELLLEPCAALLKAGAFRLPCARWGLRKLAPSTHLYTGDGAAWFKVWRIREILPFGTASFKRLRQEFPRAEITARNLPLGSEALRKKMGISPGGDAHIFACRLNDGSAVLLVCSREA